MSPAARHSLPPHVGFAARLDPSMARRQLTMSAGVFMVLVVAIAVSLFAIRPTAEMASNGGLAHSMLADLHAPASAAASVAKGS